MLEGASIEREDTYNMTLSDNRKTFREALQQRLRGGVAVDELTCGIYATDASLYEITPLGVVLPRDVDDVVATVRECRSRGISLVARGAGTGLTGGAVGPGVQLDLSRFLNRIGPIDPDARTVA